MCGKVIVYILTDDTNSNEIKLLEKNFDDPLFEVILYNLPNPKFITPDSELREHDVLELCRVYGALNDSLDNHPNNYCIVLKNNTVSDANSKSIATLVEKAISLNVNFENGELDAIEDRCECFKDDTCGNENNSSRNKRHLTYTESNGYDEQSSTGYLCKCYDKCHCYDDCNCIDYDYCRCICTCQCTCNLEDDRSSGSWDRICRKKQDCWRKYKTSLIGKCDPREFEKIVKIEKESIEKYCECYQRKNMVDWDLCYLCRWLDRCDLYQCPLTVDNGTTARLVRTFSPNGFQCILFSPKGRNKVLGIDKLRCTKDLDQRLGGDGTCKFNRFFTPVASPLGDALNDAISQLQLRALAVTPNMFEFNVFSSRNVSDLAKLSECRAPSEVDHCTRTNILPFTTFIFVTILIALLVWAVWILRFS